MFIVYGLYFNQLSLKNNVFIFSCSSCVSGLKKNVQKKPKCKIQVPSPDKTVIFFL